jgi:hypothetical protein
MEVEFNLIVPQHALSLTEADSKQMTSPDMRSECGAGLETVG